MPFEDLDHKAKRLFVELENGQIDREQYFSQIVDLLISPLYGLFYDLFQKVMMKFLSAQNRPDLSDGLNLPWFRTVARHEWIDELRRTRPSSPIDDNAGDGSETRGSVEHRRIVALCGQCLPAIGRG